MKRQWVFNENIWYIDNYKNNIFLFISHNKPSDNYRELINIQNIFFLNQKQFCIKLTSAFLLIDYWWIDRVILVGPTRGIITIFVCITYTNPLWKQMTRSKNCTNIWSLIDFCRQAAQNDFRYLFLIFELKFMQFKNIQISKISLNFLQIYLSLFSLIIMNPNKN